MTRLIESPAMVERLSKMGLEPQALGPQAFEKVLREDYDKLARIVKLAGAKAE
jgi:tripartite-type tricarboxylate transporter receptor subunit TctC